MDAETGIGQPEIVQRAYLASLVKSSIKVVALW